MTDLINTANELINGNISKLRRWYNSDPEEKDKRKMWAEKVVTRTWQLIMIREDIRLASKVLLLG